MRGTESVLLVEDESPLRNLTSHTLQFHGYTVTTAANSEEALQLAQDPQFRIDVLVTDVVLPNMSGADLATRLQSKYPGLKVLFVSGHMASVEILGDQFKDANFLQKPFTQTTLIQRMRQLLDQN